VRKLHFLTNGLASALVWGETFARCLKRMSRQLFREIGRNVRKASCDKRAGPSDGQVLPRGRFFRKGQFLPEDQMELRRPLERRK